MGSKIYPKDHENPRAFFSSSSPSLLESSIQYPWGVGLHHVRQPQKRLNPIIKEEVRKEVLKLLEADLIYPISDSALVSPVQVVPKKECMTVIRNEKNDLIPTRIVTG